MQTLTSEHRDFGANRTPMRHLWRVAGSVIGLLALMGSQAASAAVITVTGTGDTIAVDNVVTLREAITSANNNASINTDVSNQNPGVYGADTINFNISGAGVHTISPAALPVITGQVTINGYTQGGTSMNTLPDGDNAVLEIVLSGANAAPARLRSASPGCPLALAVTPPWFQVWSSTSSPATAF